MRQLSRHMDGRMGQVMPSDNDTLLNLAFYPLTAAPADATVRASASCRDRSLSTAISRRIVCSSPHGASRAAYVEFGKPRTETSPKLGCRSAPPSRCWNDRQWHRASGRIRSKALTLLGVLLKCSAHGEPFRA